MNDAPHFGWSSTGNGRRAKPIPDPFDNEQTTLVWDAVVKSDPRVTDHVSGTRIDDAISLTDCVAAFHAAAARGPFALFPEMLAALIGYFPDGAFASRTGADLLVEDVRKCWHECSERAIAEARKYQEEAREQASWLTISDEPWDPDTLPPRPWLAPPYLMRGEITLLHGPGGAGKSQLEICWALALALSRPFGRLQPKQRCRVLLTNFEDNAIEQQRRISAALRYFNATPADLRGWLFRVSLGPKGDATMFELDEHGAVRTTGCWGALERACETVRPDAVFADPLVAINAVPESDNTLMRRVMTFLLVGVARRFDCALAVAHHDTKNGADDDDGDQANARGAGDIVNAVRFELAVKTMTSKQAEQMTVEHERRGFYFRLGSTASKVNYAAPEASEWFERLAVVINGEQVVRCIPWEPPSGRLTEAMVARLIAAIGEGTPHGPYSPQVGNSDRSLGHLLDELSITGAIAQRRALRELKAHHGVVQAPWKLPGRGSVTRQGLRTAGSLPVKYEWCECDEGSDL